MAENNCSLASAEQQQQCRHDIVVGVVLPWLIEDHSFQPSLHPHLYTIVSRDYQVDDFLERIFTRPRRFFWSIRRKSSSTTQSLWPGVVYCALERSSLVVKRLTEMIQQTRHLLELPALAGPTGERHYRRLDDIMADELFWISRPHRSALDPGYLVELLDTLLRLVVDNQQPPLDNDAMRTDNNQQARNLEDRCALVYSQHLIR